MALIVEDGTGLATAESFISVADATTYLVSRGNTTWADLDTDVQEQALRRATDYMEQVYRFEWDGYRYTTVQNLSWPRYEVEQRDQSYGYRSWPAYVDYTTVPQLVRYACADLAMRAVSGSLVKDYSRQKTLVKVGPLEVQYDKNSPVNSRYPAIDNMLQPFLRRSNRYNAEVRRA